MDDSTQVLSENLQHIIRVVNETKLKCNREKDHIDIMAVTKQRLEHQIQSAQELGIRFFGENKIQELMTKFTGSLPSENREWEIHLIGTLQRNKIKKALVYCDCIQSIDRIELIESMCNLLERDKKSHLQFKNFPIYLQVCCSDYDYKHGFNNWDSLESAVEMILQQGLLKIQGLMTIAPNTRDEHILRSTFSRVRNWKEKLEARSLCSDLELSMGMSGDFKWAVIEGSTMIRIGSGLFGTQA